MSCAFCHEYPAVKESLCMDCYDWLERNLAENAKFQQEQEYQDEKRRREMEEFKSKYSEEEWKALTETDDIPF